MTDREDLRAAVRLLDRLNIALRESVRLQSHYAELLNMRDGGRRLTFATADEWIDRLVAIGDLPP